MSTVCGRPVSLGGGKAVPSIFGTGADGDLVVAAGQTTVLPVTVPHQSVVERNYKSITIAAGGILKCSDPNAGLVLRCKGDCAIHGTIDQSGMAPKTNPNNNYPYPTDLVCGAGGKGGDGYGVYGGASMPARKYGGGYGGGGSGGRGSNSDSMGKNGGSSDTITVLTTNIFIGGAARIAGSYGGGGGGLNGIGGSGAGTNGGYASNGPGAGGGAGNIGGGVALLFVGENFQLDGTINCSGGSGGNGGSYGGSGSRYYGGNGGGGGGGGGIYILHNGPSAVLGSLNVSGGAGGIGGLAGPNDGGNPGNAGQLGTVTVKQYVKGMTV